MSHSLRVCPALVALLLSACASSEPAPVAPAPTATPTPALTSSADVAPPAASASAAPALTPEQMKKAKEAAELEADRAELEREQKSELARFTPELRAEAKALAAKSYPTAKAALTAAMASKHRFPGHAERDSQRHPIETFEFLGLKPTMTVLEIGPGEGWVTELLAPTLAAKGKLMATNSDPKGPITERSTFYGQRFQSLLDRSPEVYGKVETLIVDGTAPKLGLDAKVDMVLLFRGAHGMHNRGKLKDWLGEIHKALKPNGVLGIEQHRAKEGDNVDVTAKQGYVPEKWLIEQVEAAGFKLAAKSEINANPKDTKDHPEGVWALPPTLRLKEKDRAKYVAIGESDRMTLKFTKVAAPKPAATPAKK